jgi:hypothetical protein
MSGGEIAELIALIAIFLIGVTCGVILTVSRAIKREDRKYTLTGAPPGAAARGARLLTGAGSRDTRGRRNDLTGRAR